jgi:hypothetical protein
MAINPYSSQSISGYNSSPPPDDGSQTAANKVEWAKHKEKIGDPLKTLAEAINSQAVSAFNSVALEDWSTHTTTATIAENDWHGGILMTATGRVNYPDPATLENGWHNFVFNGATANIQLQATATSYFRAVDGTVASEFTLLPGDLAKVWNTSTQYLVMGARRPVLIGVTYSFDTTHSTATGTIPFDDTIPLVTEGVQVLSVSHANCQVGNLLEVEAQVWHAVSANTGFTVAMFQNAATVAMDARGRLNFATDSLDDISLRNWVTCTATSYTFTVRMGANTGNSYLNGTSGGRRFGGAARSWVEVTEYEI